MKTLHRVLLNCIQLVTLILLTTNVSAQLKADFTATNTIGCPPMVVNFEDKSTGDPTEWKWDLGNGTISYLNSPIATYFNPGEYTVKLIVKNSNGQDVVTKTKFITVYELPKANFGASDTTGCFPLKVLFSDSSLAGSGTIASYQWDFGDGNLSTLKNPEHIYINEGDFTVTLRVVNTNGCVKVFTRPSYIKLRTGVKADFTYNISSNCKSPVLVNFINKSGGTGVLNYKWDLGNGSTSIVQDPIGSYVSTGLYTVKLIASNSSGCTDTLFRKDFVNISFVKANFNAPAYICANSLFTVTNTSTPAPLSVLWDFGDGTTSTLLSPVKLYNAPGIYAIKMVSTFTNCTDSATKNITVIGGPKVDFNAANLVGCKLPHTATFTDLTVSAGAITYLWRFGDGTTSTLASPTHTFTQYGNFAITLVVTNWSGCKDSLVKNELIKITAPKITSITDLPVRGCIPYTINPLAVVTSSEPIANYQWDFGDGTTSTAANPNHTYTVSGAYMVKLIVLTANGCTDTLKFTDAVKVGTRPSTAFSADPLDVCAQTKVTFSDLSAGTPFVHEWLWQFGDGGTSVVQNPVHLYTDTGKFNVTLITTNFGCSDTLWKEKYIHVNPPIARFDTAFLCTTPLTRNFIDKSIGATTWSWDFGDGTSSGIQFPSHTYSLPGNYKVILKVTNGTCEHTLSKFVKVVNEDPRLLSTDSISCRNARMTYTVTNVTASNIVDYTWYPMGAQTETPIVSTLYALAQYYTAPGQVNPSVIVKDVLGCKYNVSTSTPINVYGPVAGFSVPFNATCFMTAVPFNDTSKTDGIHPISNYIWSFGDGKMETLSNGPFSHQYDSAGVFGVRLTVVDTYGCRDSVYKPDLLTISKPVAVFTVSDTLVCPKVPVVFKNLSTGTNITYKWDFGDGIIATTAGATHVYSTEGLYHVNLTIIDKFGCSSSSDTLIHIVQTTADFLMSDSFSSCPPLQVDFTNRSKGFIVMSYDFGDGGISTLNNPSHIYTYPGTYFVKLGVRNNGGCTDTLIKKVVIQGPTGVFTYNPLVVCNPATIDFVANTKNAVKYIWDYNDGTTVFSTLTKTTHVYSSPGDYIPKIILEDNSGCRVPVVGKDTIRVKIIETNIVSPGAVICDSGMVAFKDSSISNDTYKSFTWNFGDGQTSTVRNVSHHYTQPGIYSIQLITKTSAGCADTAVVLNHVKIVNSPSFKIIGDTSSCIPGTLTFTGGLQRPDTSTLTWKWNLGNGQVSEVQNPPAQTYPTAGKFPVTAMVTNYDGCRDSSIRYVDIHPLPVVDAGPDSTICRATSLTLQATGALQYTWNFEPTLNCLNCDMPVAKPLTNTTYLVTGKTAFGCVATDTVRINVTQPFKITVNAGDTLCAGESITLGATGGEKYNWTPSIWLSNAGTANPVARPDSSLTYQVIGSTNNNCFVDTGYVTVKVYPMPQLSILGSDEVIVNVGNSYQLQTKNSPDITNWKWLPSTFLSCNDCPNPKITPKESRVYSVIGSNAGRCVARDEVRINLVCNNSNVFIPNTFSPNNDGSNDRFYPRGTGVFGIKSMKIFNRWGQIVFENNSFTPNDASAGWDGKLKGLDLSSDVYVYLMDVVCENSAVFPIKGNITLIR
ncbi:MAG: PKD domain-containing protein [Chitinophagaceae bacterium]|nr:PKD domain-containing protein [Chitinophagaceae bacterium]